MRAFRVAAAWGVAAGVAAAADPITAARPDDPSAPLVVWQPAVDADAVAAVGRRLEPLLAGDPLAGRQDLARQLFETMRGSPGATPEKLGAAFLRQYPEFANPERLAALRADIVKNGVEVPGALGGRPSAAAEGLAPQPRPRDVPRPPTGGPTGGPGVGPPEPSDATPGHPRRRDHRPRQEVGAGVDSAADARRVQQSELLVNAWEQHLGSLEDAPALRGMLMEVLTGPAALPPDAAEGLAAALGDATADPEAANRWLASVPELTGLDLTALGFRPDDLLAAAGPRSDAPQADDRAPLSGLSSEPSVWGAAVLVGCGVFLLVLMRGRRLLGRPGDPIASPPGPLSARTMPDRIDSRGDVVQAFETLAVAVGGEAARAWHHNTVSAELGRTVPAAADAAGRLGELYALARYAPADTPFTPEAAAEARRHVGRLRGLAAP